MQGQRQRKLEAKKIREQIEEEKRKLIDIEEAKYKEQKRKEAVEKARTQLYYQSDRVKGLHVGIASAVEIDIILCRRRFCENK